MNRSFKNVLVFLWHPESPYAGGSFEVVQSAFRERSQTGLNWYILDKENSNLKLIQRDFYKVHEYAIPAWIKKSTKHNFILGRIFEWLYLIFALNLTAGRLIRQKKIDAIYLPIAEFYILSFISSYLSYRHRIPVISVIHQIGDEANLSLKNKFEYLRRNGASISRALIESLYIRLFFSLFLFVLKKNRAVITISTVMKEQLRSLGLTDVYVNEMGFDPTPFIKFPVQDQLYDAIYLGRVIPSKGILDLLAVWKLVLQKRESAKLIIVGPVDNSYRMQLENLINDMKLSANVILSKSVFGEEKIRKYRQSKIFITLSHLESYGLTINEALSCGLPVIAYDLDAYSDRKHGNQDFFLFPYHEGSIQVIADKIIDILNSNISSRRSEKLFSFRSWSAYAQTEEDILVKHDQLY